jgi:hypothetical protein
MQDRDEPLSACKLTTNPDAHSSHNRSLQLPALRPLSHSAQVSHRVMPQVPLYKLVRATGLFGR